MEPALYSIEDLKNESDVEQKLIVPLLTSPNPIGLGYRISDFRTKPDLRKIVIGKGADSKVFYPDYVIIKAGFPLLVIEAKRPKEDLVEAFREARMYASEINSKFSTGLNPCHKVIVTDGITLIGGNWDSDEPILNVKLSDLTSVDIRLDQIIDFASNSTIEKYVKTLSGKVRGKSVFKKPTRILGGKTTQNEELSPNTFGTTISLDYRSLFNPETREERIEIVKNAYISSLRRLKHVNPIEKIIRGINPPSITNTTLISDTSAPEELLEKLSDFKNLHGQLLLLVGNVGSGKSTFTDYLKEVALPDDVKASTLWIYLDLNKAPLSKEYIYEWIKESLIEKFKEENKAAYDFDEYEVLLKLFSVEINRFNKTFGPLYGIGSEKYKEKLAEELTGLLKNKDVSLKAFTRYLCAERKKLLIVVLDNCDKRKRDDQLLMFDVANWLREYLKCLIFLPIRNTTYDHHRKEPPLDTVIKDLVFRIEPPVFEQVLYRRIQYALKTMTLKQKKLEFVLPNGMKVEYPQTDQGYFLVCILKSLFQNVFFNRVITALTGRDIRRGLELFLDFCKSGHISEDEIFKIKQSKGNHTLQNHIISRVIIRGNRRYYNDLSVLKNLFHSYPEDTFPNPFTRLAILKWLKNRYRTHGPSKTKGYHKIVHLIHELNSYGFSEDNVVKELEVLIKSFCVVTESQDLELKDQEDLISITSSGIIHIDMLTNLDYLASVSEDMWYRDQSVAQLIADRISDKKGFGHYTRQSSIDNARELKDYLSVYFKDNIAIQPETYLRDEKIETLIDLPSIHKHLENVIQNDGFYIDINKLKEEYPKGKIVDAQISSIKNYGLFVEFGINASGLAHISTFGFSREKSPPNTLFETYEEGQEILIEILSFNDRVNKFDVKVIEE